MNKQVDTYDATLVRAILMEMPDVAYKETENGEVANLILQLCFQAVRHLDSEVMRKREADSIDSMFEGLITTEEPTYTPEDTEEPASPKP